jgi:hypothetical protein
MYKNVMQEIMRGVLVEEVKNNLFVTDPTKALNLDLPS